MPAPATTARFPSTERDLDGGARRDVIVILGYTSWSGAGRRERVQREDRLTLELIDSPRVPRLLVCNPFRSLAVKLARRVTGPPEIPFPSSETRHLHEPVRMRRSDPTSIPAIERACATYERSVERAAEKMGLRQPAIVTTHPLIAGYCDFDWAGPVTYHATDDLTAYPPLERWATAFERSFERIRATRRRTVAVTGAALRKVDPSGPSAVIPNGIDPAEWGDPGEPPAWFADLPRPRMLYVGALDGRMDRVAMRQLAGARPDASIVLVGPRGEDSLIDELEALPNVTVHPRVVRSEFSGLVAAADVGLIPHVRTAQTEAMSPLKLYEYLAAGLPVVATELQGTSGIHPDRTRLVSEPTQWAGAVAEALELDPCQEEERREFLLENSWSRRFAQMLDLVLAANPAGDLSRSGFVRRPGQA
jgi:glycosyltransferase involved in cell wall biosynthesis